MNRQGVTIISATAVYYAGSNFQVYVWPWNHSNKSYRAVISCGIFILSLYVGVIYPGV